MKKSFYIITAAALSLLACSRNQEVDVPDANLSLFARTESPAETKTVVEEGVHVYWEPGDEIAVFTGDQSAKFTTDITAASGTATFKGTFGDATWPEDLDLWAVYPYSEEAVFDGETITTTLPSEQVAREGSFGKDMNLAIAHSSGTTLQFYNVGGGIRFSVTEEGIKKVMFEGLSGEIISGKVKIGMDENGKPEVKEIMGGSQFITLLPPSGQEIFEPGVWYYIVAIPGALEGGYKLRFYKDTDYARKVSEKAIEIKRSIFGSIEKADSGIDFEPQTTPFPETEEEWVASDQIVQTVSERVYSFLSLFPDRTGFKENIQFIKEQTSLLDEVIYVEYNEVAHGLGIQLKDQSWINYIFEVPGSNDYGDEEFADVSSIAENQLLTRNNNRLRVPSVPGKAKALVVAPYQSRGVDGDLTDGFITVDFSYIEEQLNDVGFSLTPLKNGKYSILDLTGDSLSQYGLIVFATHGNFEIKTSSGKICQTTLDTGLKINETDNLPAREHLARVVLYDDKGKNGHYSITSSWLEGTTTNLSDNTFNNAIVCMSACLSFRVSDMADFFTKHGAAAYCGNYYESAVQFNRPLIKSIIHSLCSGLDFSRSVDYVARDHFLTDHFLYDLLMKLYPFSFHGTLRDDLTEAFLVDPYPKLLDPDVDNGYFKLKWEQNKTTGDYSYDVYIRGNKVKTTYDTYYNGYTDISGPIDWFVVANLSYRGELLASYRSDGEPFTVKEQIPAPPQVETFPASVDAQKAFLSGMVTNRSLEGLETGFYYYKLTAQEGSTELSASEKERLVMGGKKVLSAGDYKDYFGIDLTDIEQDSKYLFVAYATDEYSQTGKGEVLSFTTGSPSVHVSSVSLNMSSLELGVGNTATLVATVLPENASNKKVTWSSSDESRATVSSQGVVKGISMGNAVITVTTEDGGKTAQCNVSVTQSTVHVQSVSLNKTDLVLTVGNSETLVATVLPENAANKSVTWTSSNPAKATVSSTGVVKGVAEGEAVVTATTVDGGKTASCFVTVRKAAQPDPGESGNALIELSCDELDWGDVEIGDNVTKTFTVKNTGTTALNISTVSIVATDNTVNPSYFSILPNSTSTVSPGNYLAFNVTFIPEAECGYYAIVSIKSNASNATEGTSTVWLTGVGIKSSSSHSVSTPEIVDLGLSVKWASFNLGATKPEEYGNYYSWGETEAMDVYSPASYKFSNGAQAFTKYNTDPYYTYLGLGIIDNKIVLDPEDDAAHVILGGKWRIPSKAEIEELIANCTWTWNWTGTTESGLAGYKVVSNIPGYTDKWIFLPAPGDRSGPDLYNAENYGYYWSSALYTDDPAYAYCLFFSPVYKALSNEARHFGISIRPVYDDK